MSNTTGGGGYYRNQVPDPRPWCFHIINELDVVRTFGLDFRALLGKEGAELCLKGIEEAVELVFLPWWIPRVKPDATASTLTTPSAQRGERAHVPGAPAHAPALKPACACAPRHASAQVAFAR